jgi:hypothetical protein
MLAHRTLTLWVKLPVAENIHFITLMVFTVVEWLNCEPSIHTLARMVCKLPSSNWSQWAMLLVSSHTVLPPTQDQLIDRSASAPFSMANSSAKQFYSNNWNTNNKSWSFMWAIYILIDTTIYSHTDAAVVCEPDNVLLVTQQKFKKQLLSFKFFFFF